jgi:hypothetical protein
VWDGVEEKGRLEFDYSGGPLTAREREILKQAGVNIDDQQNPE